MQPEEGFSAGGEVTTMEPGGEQDILPVHLLDGQTEGWYKLGSDDEYQHL